MEPATERKSVCGVCVWCNLPKLFKACSSDMSSVNSSDFFWVRYFTKLRTSVFMSFAIPACTALPECDVVCVYVCGNEMRFIYFFSLLLVFSAYNTHL